MASCIAYTSDVLTAHVLTLPGVQVLVTSVQEEKEIEMVTKNDLRKFSAPVEKLIPELQAAFKILDEKWYEIGKTLDKLPVPGGRVTTVIDDDPGGGPDHRSLEYRKYNGKKRFCIVFYSFQPECPYGEDFGETVTPFEEWGSDDKANLMESVPELFKNAEKRIREFIENVNS